MLACFMSKHFVPKLCAIMVGALMVGACQNHHQSHPTNQSTIPPSAQALFANSGHALSTQAKNELLDALKTHMAAERFVVSTHYYQVLPIDHPDSIDKNASNIWTSVIKTNEYRQNKLSSSYQDTSFRRAIDYLYPSGGDDALGTDLGELPYLRFDDEMTGATVKTVTRAVGMSDEYQALYDDIDDIRQHAGNNCVYQAQFAMSKSSTKSTKNALSNCQAQLKEAANQLLLQAQGYQIGDIKHINRCVADYKKGFDGLLGHTNQSQNAHDILYANYEACDLLHHVNRRLEPSVYTDNHSPQKELQAFQAVKVCLNQHQDKLNTLYAQGKNYQHHSSAYAQSYVDYANCTTSALYPLLGNDKAPELASDFTSAKTAMADNEQTLFYTDFSDSDDNFAKYQGIGGWLNAYKDMKAKRSPNNDTDATPPTGEFGIYGSMLSSMLDYVKQTPEQIHAQNLYQYNHLSITSLAHHNPQKQQTRLLYSLDFHSPTASQSAQLPINMDFEQGVATADMSAILPFVALTVPKYAPLPQDVPNGLMTFALPKELAQKIPSSLIYQAIISGVNKAYQHIHNEKFTPVDIGGDLFAKEIGARRAIKLELSSKELGIVYATIAKHVVAELKAYVDANPQLYPDSVAPKDRPRQNIKQGDFQADKLKTLIDNFATINSAYRTSDVGGLLQIIEGLLPLSFDGASYLYLDTKGKLIGAQHITSFDSGIYNLRTQSVNQIRYDKTLFDKHALHEQFAHTFAQPASFDGSAWLSGHINDYRLKQQAQDARCFYDQPTTQKATSTQDATEAEQLFW